MQTGLKVAAMTIVGFATGCNSSDGHVPDAAAVADSPQHADAASCTPLLDASATASCLALEPARFTGSTPLGAFDADLVYFGAGDCISHSMANVEWVDACGARIRLAFPYPATASGTKRYVPAGGYDTQATFEVQPVNTAAHDRTTLVHVDVVTWQEGDGVHTVDITVTVTDLAFQLPQLHIQGTFCDWPYYVC